MWNHNSFGDIVEGDGDFVGYVAYSLYKAEKVKWIHNFKERSGNFPTPTQIDEYFTSFHSSADCVSKYRDDAERMLNDYFNYSFSEELHTYKESLKDEKIIQTLDKTFWSSVRENVASGVVASVITAGLTGILWLMVMAHNYPITAELKKFIE
ncbi:hypothetical protein KW517_02620 [Vibrio fluvialis]|nr:hypothetical protein [Vibrio fluvialis]